MTGPDSVWVLSFFIGSVAMAGYFFILRVELVRASTATTRPLRSVFITNTSSLLQTDPSSNRASVLD